MSSQKYPDHLNPFDDDGDSTIDQPDEYPDHLDPFGVDHHQVDNSYATGESIDEYDDSMNPFGDEQKSDQEALLKDDTHVAPPNQLRTNDDNGNPFDCDTMQSKSMESSQQARNDKVISDKTNTANNISTPSQPQSLDSLEPPKPLPRTKSLLKKEQALRRQQELMSQTYNNQLTSSLVNSQYNEGNSTPIDTSTSTIPETIGVVVSLQRRKHKRMPPVVPVDFKRQVSGSIDEIDEELNSIGDKLAIIEKESNTCQEALKLPNAAEQDNFSETKSTFIELIKRKNSIVRRQKELMYKRRELKLDHIHSDIEYELRKIGNKHLSARTPEDEIKEEELLKKLVEVVEEKSDIAENLSRDLSCDSHDIEKAFARLNLIEHVLEESDKISTMAPMKQPLPPPRNALKNEHCDKISLKKLSKIATLLPKSNTIKGTMKLKRKRLFKKNDPQSTIDR